MDYPGNLFVISAPSGAGKSSLVKALLQLDARLSLTISHTTRPPRGQEQNAREYYFVDPAKFAHMVEAGLFIEWAHVHDQCYGTSRAAIEQEMGCGRDVILEVDYQGALQVRQLYANAVLIFILPPSWEILRKRLESRAEDSVAVIETRLQNAAKEMGHAQYFDFVIINDQFDEALLDMRSIVHAHRLLYGVQRRDKPEVFKSLSLV